ncbi:MAG: SUF system NifU family Fe-S cluster assembly protein [Puniceicoccales bacterium]|jgi:nitrogen fixation NifU-like protein|nr:SUF system NifU family Fe-S cluster assembly protein [Puniceicoccales bacterium]
MEDWEELYQEIVLEHSRSPRNYGSLEEADGRATGHNASCGDSIVVAVRLRERRLQTIRFCGEGCAISRASASLMASSIEGSDHSDALRQIDGTIRALAVGEPTDLGPCSVLLGVRKFPMRVKCATLPWHALREALADATASTARRWPSECPGSVAH